MSRAVPDRTHVSGWSLSFCCIYCLYIYICIYIVLSLSLSLFLYSLIVSLSPLNVIIWIQLIDVNALLRIGGRNLFVVLYWVGLTCD